MEFDDNIETKINEHGNLVFEDYQGRELKADPSKLSSNYEPLCKTCRKDYRTCENFFIRDEDDNGNILADITNDGYPLVYYCQWYFKS